MNLCGAWANSPAGRAAGGSVNQCQTQASQWFDRASPGMKLNLSYLAANRLLSGCLGLKRPLFRLGPFSRSLEGLEITHYVHFMFSFMHYYDISI